MSTALCAYEVWGNAIKKAQSLAKQGNPKAKRSQSEFTSAPIPIYLSDIHDLISSGNSQEVTTGLCHLQHNRRTAGLAMLQQASLQVHERIRFAHSQTANFNHTALRTDYHRRSNKSRCNRDLAGTA